MELIPINQSKMKIMLSAPDLQYYELSLHNPHDLSCEDEDVRGAFRHIFDDVEAKTGFHTKGEKLFVQMFTSKCGGCEIFVTRLGTASSAEAAFGNPSEVNDTSLTPQELELIDRILESGHTEGGLDHMNDNAKEAVSLPTAGRRTRKEEITKRKTYVMIDSLDLLLSVCHRLMRLPYEGISRAYVLDHGASAYALYLELPDCVFYTLPEVYAFLKEYGDITRNKYSELFLLEHGRVLCAERAVETLGSLHI